jgi:hypothetical protein
MSTSDVVLACLDGMPFHKINALTEYLRQLVLHFAQFNCFGLVFLFKPNQHADAAVLTKIVVQNRAEKTHVANIVLLTKRFYFLFVYRYVAVHIFTAFILIISPITAE